jgi:3-oxoacyl-[acyl-carrier protein] reductase
MKIDGAHVLVTGGSSGIGREIARLLREKGAKVAICGRRKDRIEAAAEEIDALPIIADVAVEEQVVRMVDRVIEGLGDYDVLINNAGFGAFAPLMETKLAEMKHLYATNVFGAMLVARESVRHFIRRGGGNIVNVSSTAGSKGFAGGTMYASSKFALSGMTECWRAELRKHDIRVMQVNPSEVVTEFFSAMGQEREPNPTKLRPIEIAHAVASMLEMDDRGFVTDLTVWATNPKG